MWEPFGVANVTAGWRSGSNERGTLDVLSTCLFTLVLCIYTCLHLNIPGPDERTWAQRAKRKSLWLMVGLFAPEFVAFTAFYDWYLAKNMTHCMKKALDPLVVHHAKTLSARDDETTTVRSYSPPDGPKSTEPSRDAGRSHYWTRTHSHFALMGGYAFDMTGLPINIAPKKVKTLTLSTSVLRQLAKFEPHLIPDISVEEIRDKSKADSFTKALVCIQSSWFAAQMIGRLFTQCPISLLEMNTFLHALCCLIIYIAWWHKPLDIEEPNLIDVVAKDAQAICAWLITYSNLQTGRKVYRDTDANGHMPHSTLGYYEGGKVKLPWLNQETVEEAVKINLSDGRPTIIDPAASDAPWSTSGNQCDSYLTMYSGQSCHDYCFWASRFQGHVNPKSLSIRLTLAEVECLRLSSQYEKCIPDSDTTIRAVIPSDTVLFQPTRLYHNDKELMKPPERWFSFLKRFCDDSDDIQDRFLPTMFFTGVAAAGALYGGAHLSAWHSRFPSPAERYMWRTSCFLIATPLLTLLVFGLVLISWHVVDRWIRQPAHALKQYLNLARLCGRLHDFWDDKGQYQMAWVSRRLIESYALLYAAARVFLIVESFINLAHLPDGVFRTPEWSKYIPHVGSG